MLNNQFIELKRRLLEINDLNSALAILTWDQATMMPPGGAAARGRQMATLKKLAHEHFVDPRLGELLESLKDLEKDLAHDSWEAALIRVTRKDYDKAVRVPPEFMARFASHSSSTYEAWIKAKAANDFKSLVPCLEKTLDLSREYSGYFSGAEHIADPLIDNVDDGFKAKMVSVLFDELRRELVPLVKIIAERPLVDEMPVRGRYEVAKQLAFGEDVIRRFGYDFSRGRQDKTHHPFMIKFSLGDVRITTRYKDDDVTDCLFSTMHEAGHAMYEQGVSSDFEGTPLARGTSMGVHESQSRLWENLVGRSRDFWNHFYPKLSDAFPDPLKNISVDQFYRIINKVEPSLIRTDADEVTYNLHVMIRFDLELALLEDKLKVKDMPDAWNSRYQKDLGVTPPNDSLGVMQDVHWHADFIGGQFQCYTLGNILSAQFFEAAVKANPTVPADIGRGEFATLRNWLTTNLYRHGSVFDASEIVKRVTGKDLTIAPYMTYLKKKYGGLYGLKL